MTQELLQKLTLEELIEECGDNFKKLWRHSNGKYTAHGGTKTNGDSFQVDDINAKSAVANLYLIINKK